MEHLEVTMLSSKGQIVLPQSIRLKLHLTQGEKFIVLGDKDTVILKKIERPALERAKMLVKESRAYAKRAGLTQADVKETIRKARAESK